MKYKVREVDPFTYTPTIEAMHHTCFGDTAPEPDVSKGWWWLVWDEDNVPVAFAALIKTKNGLGYLYRVGVLPQHRRLGIHTRLIKVREAKAKREGITTVVSDTTEYAMPSSNNLIRAGYKLYKPRNPWATKISLYWKKTLV